MTRSDVTIFRHAFWGYKPLLRRPLQSCVTTFLPSFESQPQNVPLLSPKLHYGAMFQIAIPKTWRSVFTPLCTASRMCHLIFSHSDWKHETTRIQRSAPNLADMTDVESTGRMGWMAHRNGKKVSNSQACCLAQLCLAAA